MVLSKTVALTVDLEEWAVPEDFGLGPVPESIKLKVACKGLNRILDIFTLEEVTATFFVTTYFARRHSELLRMILAAGHEIGNHGLEHARRPRRTLKDEVEAIKESTRVIEESARMRPCGYREPYLAIGESTIVALTQVGYLYDSSVLGTWLPNKNQWIAVPSTPFKWKTKVHESQKNLVELPLSVFPKLRVPVGWWWFRKNFGETIPLATASLLFRRAHPFIVNIHTWELTGSPPQYRVPFHVRYNCGERSVEQLHRLIIGLKRLGAEFVLMKTMALDYSISLTTRQIASSMVRAGRSQVMLP